MTGFLAIAAYRSLHDGVPGGTLDIRVLWYAESDPEKVRELIREEPLVRYPNSDGEEVCWELAEIFAVEPFDPKESGDEVVGFIAGIDELKSLI